jgi:hypothetical protein
MDSWALTLCMSIKCRYFVCRDAALYIVVQPQSPYLLRTGQNIVGPNRRNRRGGSDAMARGAEHRTRLAARNWGTKCCTAKKVSSASDLVAVGLDRRKKIYSYRCYIIL